MPVFSPQAAAFIVAAAAIGGCLYFDRGILEWLVSLGILAYAFFQPATR